MASNNSAALFQDNDYSEGYDQHFHLTDEVTGKSLAKRFYRMTYNGRVIEGYSDDDGHTTRVESSNPGEVKIEIFPEGYGEGLT